MKALYLWFLGCAYGNPFEPITELYVNPTLASHIDGTIPKIQNQKIIDNMNRMKDQPSAYWMDSKNKIHGSDTSTMEGIMDDIVQKNVYKAVSFIIYDLPNRDCKALASNGEICCNADDKCQQNKGGYCNIPCQRESTTCADALKVYKSEYITQIVSVLSQDKYNAIRKILILEPDSLPNCVTNLGSNGCTKITCDNYKEGITFAIQSLSKIPNAFLYVDAAHGGWLGWEDTLKGFVKILEGLPTEKIRGFVTNTANYQPLGEACDFGKWERYYDVMKYCEDNKNKACCADPCGFHGQFNAANNEMNFAQLLYSYTSTLPFATEDGKCRVVIDTGRNGNTKARIGAQACKAWCNVNHAHIGVFPTTNTSVPFIDAFAWLKTPGESDGCIDYQIQKRCMDPKPCGRYDELCGTLPENIGYATDQPCPPEAGQW